MFLFRTVQPLSPKKRKSRKKSRKPPHTLPHTVTRCPLPSLPIAFIIHIFLNCSFSYFVRIFFLTSHFFLLSKSFMSISKDNWWWIFAICASVVLLACLVVMLVCTCISYQRRSHLHKSIWEEQKRYTQLVESEEALERNRESARSSRSIGTELSDNEMYRSMYSVYSVTDEETRNNEHENRKRRKKKQQLPTVLSMRDLSQPRVSVHRGSRSKPNDDNSNPSDPATQRHCRNSAVSISSRDDPQTRGGSGRGQDAVADSSTAPVREPSMVGRGFTNCASEKKSRTDRRQSFVLEDILLLDSPTEDSHLRPSQPAPPALVAPRGQSLMSAAAAGPPPQPIPIRVASTVKSQKNSTHVADGPTSGSSSGQQQSTFNTNKSRPSVASNPFSMMNVPAYPTESSGAPYTYYGQR